MAILKKLFAPVQQQVLDKKMCPACTRKLNSQKQRKILSSTKELVRCLCGRYYIYNAIDQKYKRASEAEVLRTANRSIDLGDRI
jgi:ubiquitin C-terminal hydrolase